MQNLQKTSKFYKRLFIIFFVAIIILVPVFWATVQTNIDIFSYLGISQSLLNGISHPLSLHTRVLALTVSLIPTFTILYILYLLIKLFSCYQKLEVFSTKVVFLYRRLGWSLVYWFIAEIIYQPIISLVLSFNNPVGERFISITIGPINILALITGGIIITISMIMQKAQEISDENNLTI